MKHTDSSIMKEEPESEWVRWRLGYCILMQDEEEWMIPYDEAYWTETEICYITCEQK